MRMGIILPLLGLLLFQACQKTDRYLYYYQKPPLEEQNEEFTVKELSGNSQVDIVWVIDNSGSMGEEQQDVVDNAKLFMQEFVKSAWIQWKIGIISTDESEDPFLGFDSSDQFVKGDPDPVDRFKKAVQRLGIMGSGTEKSFFNLKRHFDNYPGFLRKNAALAMIFVTDEDEGGESFGGITTPDFVKYLLTKKSNINTIRAYGIFGAQDLGCSAGSFSYASSRFEEIFGVIKGLIYPVCSPDFGKNLADLGKDIVSAITYPRLLLKERPLPASIKVFYEKSELPGGKLEEGGIWTYDYSMNAIQFYNLDFAENDDLGKVQISYAKDNGFE